MNNPIPSAARLSIWLPGLLNLLPGFGTDFPSLVTGFLRQNSLFYGKRQAVLRSPGFSKVVNRLRNEELVHTQRAPKTAADYLSSNSDFRFFFFTRSIIIQDVPARPSPGAHPFGKEKEDFTISNKLIHSIFRLIFRFTLHLRLTYGPSVSSFRQRQA